MRGRARRAFTLIEVMVVMTMIGILSAMCAWTFPRAVEQARADLAAANLRTIWAAQRFFRLENGLYADSLELLRQRGLLDAGILSPADPPELIAAQNPSYLYEITGSDLNTFSAAATRTSGAALPGERTLEIDESGVVSGSIRLGSTPPGRPSITPGRIFTASD